MKRFTIGDEEVEIDGEPSMRTVKYVQEMEIQMMREYIDDDVLLQMEGATNEEFMEDIFEDADIDDLTDMMWSRSAQEPLQTICLATDRKFTMDDIMSMGAKEFRDLLDTCREELGGDAPDFIESLGIGIDSQEKMMEMAEEETSFDQSSDAQQPSGSKPLRNLSGE